MKNKKVTVNNEKEFKEVMKWFKNSFPKADKNDIKKFKQVIKGQYEQAKNQKSFISKSKLGIKEYEKGFIFFTIAKY